MTLVLLWLPQYLENAKYSHFIEITDWRPLFGNLVYRKKLN